MAAQSHATYTDVHQADNVMSTRQGFVSPPRAWSLTRTSGMTQWPLSCSSQLSSGV